MTTNLSVAAGPGRTVAWLAKQVELALAPLDLSLAQYRVLGLLAAGPSQASAVADRLAVRPPSVTALVDGLVARGLVDRTAVAEDRRRVSLTVTAAGRALMAAADEAADDRLASVASLLDGDGGADRAADDLARWYPAIRLHHQAQRAARP